MFGNLNKPAFGAAAPTNTFGFGATTTSTPPQFGQAQGNIFGKPATPGFGQPATSTFGQPQNNTFFAGAQPQQTSLFQNANTSFGAPATSQAGFGATGGLFGQQPSTSGLFNSPTSFGQQAKPAGFGGFGQTQAQPVMFGQQAQPAQASAMFQPQSSNLFGGTGFGAQQQQQTGTVVKFNPVTGTDTMMKGGASQNINTKHYSITCMKEYENKSFEELRWEDYQANRKGPQQSTGFGAAPFGGTATATPSLFGQPDQTKTAFGATTGFGQPAASTFGQSFGMTNQTSTAGGLFSKPTAFGAPTSTTNTGFTGFGGAPQNANPFGGAQAAKPFGATAPTLFGAASTAQPAQTGFGQTPGGLFGTAQTQNQSTGLFGKPAQPAPAFGQPSTGFGFNQPAASQATSVFPASKPTLFGQTNTTTSAFGQTGSAFGQPSTGLGFGSTLSKPGDPPAFGSNVGMGFGSTLGGGMMQQQNTGLFGNTQKPSLFSTPTAGGSLFGNTNPLMTNTGFGMQNQAQQQSLLPQMQAPEYNNLALKTSDAFGDAPHLAGLEPKLRTDPHPSIATNPVELKSLLDSTKKVDMSHGTRLKRFPQMRKDSLFDGLQKSDTESPEYTQKSVRRLVVNTKIPEHSGNILRDEISKALSPPPIGRRSLTKEGGASGLSNSLLENSVCVGAEPRKSTTPLRLNFENSTILEETTAGSPGLGSSMQNLGSFNSPSSFLSVGSKNVSGQATDNENVSGEPYSSGDNSLAKHPTGIVNTRPEYYTLPSVDDLTQYLDENGACMVKGFTIGRTGYGNVYFPDEMDVSGLNMDQLVQFRYREINIYPDETKKPPIGQGLNRKAQVTLDNVYPKRAGTNALIKDVSELLQMNFAEKLRKVTVKKAAKFVDYRPETGSWVFKVEHFSKYGYNDSDEENEHGENAAAKKMETMEMNGLSQAKSREDLDVLKRFEQERESEMDDMEVASREPTKYGLENDIFIEDEAEQHIDDVIQQSMYVDLAEENYHSLPQDLPMHMPYDSYKHSKNIQIMKSTLFADDDRSSEASSHVSIIRQYLDIPEEMPTVLPPIREEVVPRRRPVLRPKVDTVYNFEGEEEEEEKSRSMPTRCYMDMGLFKGRSFKIGWTKGFNFINLSVNNKLGSEIQMKTLCFGSKNNPIGDCLLDSLKIVLQESSFDLNDSQIPTFKITKSNDFLLNQCEIFEKLSQKFKTPETQYLHSIWTLCTALWGPAEETTYNRRYLLSEWLKNNTNHVEEYSQTVSISSIDEKINTIFNLLTVFKVLDAANLAMDNKFHHLSLLLSQLSATNRVKEFLQEQIESWYHSMASEHISHGLKKIYMLLSGIPTKADVNVFENVDWKRAFAMHLWYVIPNGASLESGIDLYKAAFEEHGYAERPLPPYCKSLDEESSFDVLYHVLLLYVSRIHRLSSVLNPATHTDDPLDYRLSWLLFQLFQSLEVGLIDPPEKNKLCTSFSNQLENLGHWEWAIFVLLFLEDNVSKKKLVMGILDRHLSEESDKQALNSQNNLINNMKIPYQWIHVVKGQKTLLSGNYYVAFNHFAHAEEYPKANDIFIEHILPGLFINQQYDLIKSLLDNLQNESRRILNWNHEAGLVLDFLRLQESVISYNEDDLYYITNDLQSITERLVYFPTKTDQQKLCVAEISKRCSWVYKDLNKKIKNVSFTLNFPNFIDSLVMPPDYKQNEGLYLING